MTVQKKYSFIFLLPIILIYSCAKNDPSNHPTGQTSPVLQAKFSRPLADVKFESSTERIAKGKYLVESVLWCMNCHTERDQTKPGWPPLDSKKGSGALVFQTDSTYLYAPNITSDKETGIGNFSDDMIAWILREGIGHDGRALTYMPWWSFRNLSDEDVASIVSYLRTIPPIKHEVPKRNLGIKGEENLVNLSSPLYQPKEPPDPGNRVSRGRYLIALADCMGCHTGWYARNPGLGGGGNPIEHNEDNIFSTNISSDITGVGGWSPEIFRTVMRTGKSGFLDHRMPWIVFKNMTDEDLDAIYQALLATYPVKHLIMNRIPPSYCEVCQFEHGLGDQNKLPALKPFREDYTFPADFAGKYYNESIIIDTISIEVSQNTFKIGEKEIFLINDTQYFADGLLAPLSFLTDENGQVSGLIYQGFEMAYKKVQ